MKTIDITISLDERFLPQVIAGVEMKLADVRNYLATVKMRKDPTSKRNYLLSAELEAEVRNLEGVVQQLKAKQ